MAFLAHAVTPRLSCLLVDRSPVKQAKPIWVLFYVNLDKAFNRCGRSLYTSRFIWLYRLIDNSIFANSFLIHLAFYI